MRKKTLGRGFTIQLLPHQEAALLAELKRRNGNAGKLQILREWIDIALTATGRGITYG